MIFNANRFHFMPLLTWQFIIYFGAQQIFSIFANYVPSWRCGDGPEGTDCSEFHRCGGNVTFSEIPFHSAALEFELICSPISYVIPLFSQVQFFGVLSGTLTSGLISDAWGRKPTAILALSIGVLASFLTGVVSTWKMLLVVRYFVGLSIGGCLVGICTYVMELILPEQRMALRGFFNWGIARFAFTIICYLFPNWRSASMAFSASMIPALLLIIFILPESPDRLEEMRKAEKYIAKFAGIPYVPVKHKKLVKQKTVCEMIKTPDHLAKLAGLWVMWFTASLCGKANDLSSGKLSGNLYVNQMLFSVITYISKMVLYFIDTYNPRFSRRLLHQGSQLVVCISFTVLAVLVYLEYSGDALLIINIIGTVFNEYTWDACYLCTIESMETSCRAGATGTCSLMARFGAILAPFLTYLSAIWAPFTYATVVVLGLINFTQSYLFLKETKGVNLDNVTCNDDDEELEELT